MSCELWWCGIEDSVVLGVEVRLLLIDRVGLFEHCLFAVLSLLRWLGWFFCLFFFFTVSPPYVQRSISCPHSCCRPAECWFCLHYEERIYKPSCPNEFLVAVNFGLVFYGDFRGVMRGIAAFGVLSMVRLVNGG